MAYNICDGKNLHFTSLYVVRTYIYVIIPWNNVNSPRIHIYHKGKEFRVFSSEFRTWLYRFYPDLNSLSCFIQFPSVWVPKLIRFKLGNRSKSIKLLISPIDFYFYHRFFFFLIFRDHIILSLQFSSITYLFTENTNKQRPNDTHGW